MPRFDIIGSVTFYNPTLSLQVPSTLVSFEILADVENKNVEGRATVQHMVELLFNETLNYFNYIFYSEDQDGNARIYVQPNGWGLLRISTFKEIVAQLAVFRNWTIRNEVGE